MNAITKPRQATAVFDHPEFDDHEDVMFIRDRATGLSAIVAVHSTALGPALGGCRVWPYAHPTEALQDALRLSKGMTYKNALAGLDLGGGKAVIIADSGKDKTEAMMEAFGAHVDRLNGTYITAEDVGVTTDDMDAVARRTTHVRGTSAIGLGDPSPYTALGVFEGIKAAARHVYGTDDLSQRTVSVQGLGHVGFDVARHLHEAGARLILSDIRDAQVDNARSRFGAEAVSPDQAHAVDADIFAPCALGAGLNHRTIPDIKARIVAGAANNQLETAQDGVSLKERGILYAPDYAINAGGVISIALATEKGHETEVRAKTLQIGATLTEIFNRALGKDETPETVADEMAEERLKHAG
ncbi:Glu/Leu/Phe/Val dehydrogenase dimerization domain-containing protein [Roseibium sp. RKSG952]|uniref:Glu/Leu/Phe/Val dehydrogenase dimerization domain-containing protein n=1 Tax=Roseibium sp. RKSG952 TaxID=2529384 RepID=UPI0012BBE2BB|nr:Glu/Leu/Phe/Val dehydrogenase dimerization domain-containing protein [Roseibium sp. RKSG952]MTI00082.1 Glu/Leu/Phe/Val dehydrogenase [Roseibium sp. RKSG952]